MRDLKIPDPMEREICNQEDFETHIEVGSRRQWLKEKESVSALREQSSIAISYLLNILQENGISENHSAAAS